MSRSTPWIPIALDDRGLRPIPFRVLCLVWRRAGTERGCFQKVDNIASTCRISRRAAQNALRELVVLGLVRVLKPGGGRKPNSTDIGLATEYAPVHPDDWPDLETAHEVHRESQSIQRTNEADTVHERAAYGARTGPDTVHLVHPKVIPVKELPEGLPLKGVQAVACATCRGEHEPGDRLRCAELREELAERSEADFERKFAAGQIGPRRKVRKVGGQRW